MKQTNVAGILIIVGLLLAGLPAWLYFQGAGKAPAYAPGSAPDGAFRIQTPAAPPTTTLREVPREAAPANPDQAPTAANQAPAGAPASGADSAAPAEGASTGGASGQGQGGNGQGGNGGAPAASTPAPAAKTETPAAPAELDLVGTQWRIFDQDWRFDEGGDFIINGQKAGSWVSAGSAVTMVTNESTVTATLQDGVLQVGPESASRIR